MKGTKCTVPVRPVAHRALFIILLLACAAYASSFGYSRITLTRTWEITSNDTFDFTGALAVNDTNQRVVSVTTVPEMETSYDENGTITLHYAGNGTMTLKANAIVDIDYDPVLSSDPPVPGTALPSSNLTMPDANITNRAHELAHGNSSLETVRDMVNWVNGYVTYDISYWGKSKPAVDVYRERRGVCVEYTHLLISLARSLGFETRYVSGYVHTTSWQPHAWAEILIPGQGWVAADATFAQAGILESTHLAMRKSEDQSASYDLLLSQDENVDIRATDSLVIGFESEDPKGVSVDVRADESSYVIDVEVANGRADYVLGTYTIVFPDAYGGDGSSVMLLRPNESVRLYHGLNRSGFEEGLFYTVPVSASFNDATDDDTFSIDLYALPDGEQPADGGSAGGCGQSAALLVAGALAVAYIKLRRR